MFLSEYMSQASSRQSVNGNERCILAKFCFKVFLSDIISPIVVAMVTIRASDGGHIGVFYTLEMM
jgi:hypothetical protein